MTNVDKSRRIRVNHLEYCENCSNRAKVVKIETETHIVCEMCKIHRIICEDDLN